MVKNSQESSGAPEYRFMRVLLLVYCLFIMYGSLIPFRFRNDVVLFGAQSFGQKSLLYRLDTENISIPDLVSNVLFFVPFGMLAIGANFRTLLGFRPWAAVLVCGISGLIFSLAIEAGQVFEISRTSSTLDVMYNTFGALAGGFIGTLWFKVIQKRLRGLIVRVLHEDPVILILLFFVVVLMVDAFYPFRPTLDVSTIWGNLKRIQSIPMSIGANRSWDKLIIEKGLLFATVGYLVYRSFRSINPKLGNKLCVWLVVFLFSVFLEGGKSFFVGRVPSVGKFILCNVGAFIGIAFAPLVVRLSIIQKHWISFLFGLTLLLIAYAELAPFNWAYSVDEISLRVSGMCQAK